MIKIESTVEALPRTLPLIPLHGAVLLPHAQIPIPFTEREYSLILAPVIQKHGFVGIVQPLTSFEEDTYPVPLFKTGCLGQLVDVREMEDNRVLCLFGGVCRFEILEDFFDESSEYRKAFVSYTRYSLDLCTHEAPENESLDRERLLAAIQGYFCSINVQLDFDEIFSAPDQRLITALTMVCPLDAKERQALLELPSLAEQSKLMTALIEIGMHEKPYRAHSYLYH